MNLNESLEKELNRFKNDFENELNKFSNKLIRLPIYIFLCWMTILCIAYISVYSQATKQKKDKNKTAIVKQNIAVAKDTITFVDKNGNKIIDKGKSGIAKRIKKK